MCCHSGTLTRMTGEGEGWFTLTPKGLSPH